MSASKCPSAQVVPKWRCENFLYRFKAAPGAARATDTAGAAGLPLTLPPGCASTPVSWRENPFPFGAAAGTARKSPGRSEFDKGTRDAVIVDYFLGTVGIFADAATLNAVEEIVTSDAPDPAALRRIDWELAPFYCSDCGLNYCRADWRTIVLVDEGFYDCTMGWCPNGHEHIVDD